MFFLTTIVGRVWSALSLFRAVIDQYALQGPWEIALALRNSTRAALANVAAGWAEPDEMYPPEDIPRCPDPNVLIVREVFEWPDPEGIQALAFAIGGNVEDAFGFNRRRFLVLKGPGAGQFDPSRYRSGR